mgnify:CR=1 FL=1
MATSNYKGTRLPLIALDYNSRFLAEKKEILFDYKTGKLYVVSAEDKSVIFDITRNILKEVEKNVDIKKLQEEFKVFEDKIGVRVFLQHENIFKTMHRI